MDNQTARAGDADGALLLTYLVLFALLGAVWIAAWWWKERH
jgi:hypothetical protein